MSTFATSSREFSSDIAHPIIEAQSQDWTHNSAFHQGLLEGLCLTLSLLPMFNNDSTKDSAVFLPMLTFENNTTSSGLGAPTLGHGPLDLPDACYCQTEVYIPEENKATGDTNMMPGTDSGDITIPSERLLKPLMELPDCEDHFEYCYEDEAAMEVDNEQDVEARA